MEEEYQILKDNITWEIPLMTEMKLDPKTKCDKLDPDSKIQFTSPKRNHNKHRQMSILLVPPIFKSLTRQQKDLNRKFDTTNSYAKIRIENKDESRMIK